MDEQYPRVLVVNGHPFTTTSATGLTLNSLFRGWPRDKLACLYTVDLPTSADVCETYWQLSVADIPLARVAYRVLGKPGTRQRRDAHAPQGSDQERKLLEMSPGSSAALEWVKRVVNKHALLHLQRYRVPESMWEAIRRFRPQILYSMLGANPIMRLVLDVRERCRVPVVPHLMDDWPTTLYGASAFRTVLRSRMKRDFDRILACSPVRLTIGSEMAQEYLRRYGGEFTPFMNAVEPEWLVPSDAPSTNRRRVRVTYVGGLHLNRWKSLREVGTALAALSGEGLDSELLVYTQTHFANEAKQLEMPGVIRVMRALPPSEVPAVLRDSDILLHVESFDTDARTYARYSVSTKIPECMGAGRPILAYGPGELASVRYVVDSGAGVAVGTRDERVLAACLRELIRSAAVRQRLGSRGFEVASTRHHASRQREEFRGILGHVAFPALQGRRDDRAR
ncbi:glycosyltransferase family protein [Anaeromyxobacter oryzae]|uniref:Glycosyltransferase subfamily 4-like N-terminal domain-containing protein n=1 Tax=Anaeromyxobacter oryzae TaxID=2918170 RepID=A0ABM7WVA7_9BACT|nr:hypothetical protein [Anaeromyxobacter oryzae]BDG03441.1 hypothetical protein AMOR_24370 [Anaeromyxobacter oryzae]